MESMDIDAPTIGAYLIALLRQVWEDGEGFNGKRPWGNSGWEFEVYEALVRGGLIPGKFDSCGYLEDVDTKAAHALVLTAIDALAGYPDE